MRLLVVHHSPTASLKALTDAVITGASDPDITGVEVVPVPALDATSTDVLAADGYVLVTAANFGYMSGGLKVFFDATFHQIGGALDTTGSAGISDGPTARRPYGLLVHGRYDTEGAVRSVRALVGALGWRQAASVASLIGDVTPDQASVAADLGATLAALLATTSD